MRIRLALKGINVIFKGKKYLNIPNIKKVCCKEEIMKIEAVEESLPATKD